ncbi:MAG: hypothetical protein PF442_13675 [Desulfobulbaceae bacterium]|jgi:hypothetical protein|nr:hypothetical protein [Desulfobulbaceae bacterium]
MAEKNLYWGMNIDPQVAAPYHKSKDYFEPLDEDFKTHHPFQEIRLANKRPLPTDKENNPDHSSPAGHICNNLPIIIIAPIISHVLNAKICRKKALFSYVLIRSTFFRQTLSKMKKALARPTRTVSATTHHAKLAEPAIVRPRYNNFTPAKVQIKAAQNCSMGGGSLNTDHIKK